MTARELEQIASLTEQIARMREDIAALSERISALIELREANGTLYSTRFASFEKRCAERHGQVVQRLEALEQSERRSFGALSKLQGMAAPAAIFVAIVSIILNFLR